MNGKSENKLKNFISFMLGKAELFPLFFCSRTRRNTQNKMCHHIIPAKPIKNMNAKRNEFCIANDEVLGFIFSHLRHYSLHIELRQWLWHMKAARESEIGKHFSKKLHINMKAINFIARANWFAFSCYYFFHVIVMKWIKDQLRWIMLIISSCDGGKEGKMQIIDFQLAVNSFLSSMEILLMREFFDKLSEGDLWNNLQSKHFTRYGITGKYCTYVLVVVNDLKLCKVFSDLPKNKKLSNNPVHTFNTIDC